MSSKIINEKLKNKKSATVTTELSVNKVGEIYERPWGYYQTLSINPNAYQVKLLFIKPGCRLSKQLHNKRSEHWTIVEGKPTVTIGSQVKTCQVNDSMYIQRGAVHRIENLSGKSCKIIEVQIGNYLGEDDIVRIEDDYGRASIQRDRLFSRTKNNNQDQMPNSHAHEKKVPMQIVSKL